MVHVPTTGLVVNKNGPLNQWTPILSVHNSGLKSDERTPSYLYTTQVKVGPLIFVFVPRLDRINDPSSFRDRSIDNKKTTNKVELL